MCLLQLISNLWFSLTMPLVINILSAHYLWLAKLWNFYHESFFVKEKSLNLEIFNPQNFRIYSGIPALFSKILYSKSLTADFSRTFHSKITTYCIISYFPRSKFPEWCTISFSRFPNLEIHELNYLKTSHERHFTQNSYSQRG